MSFDKRPYKKSWQKKEPKVNEYKQKRGKLAPLMAEEQKSTANIQEQSGACTELTARPEHSRREGLSQITTAN